jgi:hypothetical protein
MGKNVSLLRTHPVFKQPGRAPRNPQPRRLLEPRYAAQLGCELRRRLGVPLGDIERRSLLV